MVSVSRKASADWQASHGHARKRIHGCFCRAGELAPCPGWLWRDHAVRSGLRWRVVWRRCNADDALPTSRPC